MIDFHSHFLHNFDDGSHNVAESITMLKESYKQGVDTIVSTSHFRLGEHKINAFVTDRRNRLDEIKAALTDADKKEIPKIILGSEIEYIPGMHKWDYLDQLTIQGTNYLLLEMPFVPWTESMINTVEYICYNTPYIPIIPHIDRYFILMIKPKYYKRLFNLPVIIQLNGIFANNPNNISHLKNLIDNRVVHLLGSDCHSAEWRPPNLGRTQKVITETCDPGILDEIDYRGRQFLETAHYEEL